MKTVTVEQFLKFRPCWLNSGDGEERIRTIAGKKKNWSALDILRLENVSADNRLWSALREELIDAPILHEFACRCAEEAMKLVDKPDPQSIAAIEAKRKWLRGEISGAELAAARAAVRAAALDAARAAVRAAAWDAAWDAVRDGQIKLLIDMLEAEQ